MRALGVELPGRLQFHMQVNDSLVALKAAVHRWEREQTKLNERMDAIIREHAGEMEKPN